MSVRLFSVIIQNRVLRNRYGALQSAVGRSVEKQLKFGL